MTRRAGIYVRISRDRVGAGLGVKRQREDCEQLGEKQAWSIIDTYVDNDMSAFGDKRRAGYQRLLADLRAGTINAVLVWHTDRLYRKPNELETLITVCDEQGAPTHAVTAGPIDLSTAQGRLNARIAVAVAAHEVEHMIERQVRAKQQAALDGKYRGSRRPYGYDSDGVTVRADEAARIREMSERVLSGDSLRAVAADLTDRGLVTSTGAEWTAETIRKILLRPRTAGFVEAQGEIVATAQWDPILDENTWRTVCTYLGDPARLNRDHTSLRWLGSGVYLCGVCGDKMRGATTHGSGNAYRPAYRCRSKKGAHLSRIAEPVDAMVSDIVVERMRKPDALRLIDDEDATGGVADLSSQATMLRAKLDELTSLYTESAITGRQLADGTRQVTESLEDVESRMAAAASSSVLSDLIGVEDVEVVWRELPVSRRKAVIDALMTVTLLPAKRGRQPGGGYFDPTRVQIEWKR